MSNTLSIRLPQDLWDRLREVSRRSGLPVGRLVRRSLETTLSEGCENPLLEFAGAIKGGPSGVSSRKGFSSK